MKKSSSIGGIAKRGCFGCLAVFVVLFTLGFIVLGILWWRLAVETRAVDDEDTGTVAVAFYFDPSDNKAALRCWVNGIPGDFFIDSGMEAALALQSRFADFSKVPITGKAKVLAYQTFEECRLGEVAQLAVGESDQFLQLEQTRQNTEIGNWDYLPEFDGLLGAKILTRHRAKIDFGASRITFHRKDQGSSSGQAGPASDKRPLTQRPGQISVPFALGSTGSVMVEVTIGDATGLFVVDTGAEYCMISPGFRSRTGLPSGRAVKGLSNNIPTSAELIEADAVSFGSSARAAGSVSIIVSSLDALSSHVRGSGGREIDGILGANLLTEYEAVIDYGSQTLTLSTSPRGSWEKAWASLKWLAFKYE